MATKKPTVSVILKALADAKAAREAGQKLAKAASEGTVSEQSKANKKELTSNERHLQLKERQILRSEQSIAAAKERARIKDEQQQKEHQRKLERMAIKQTFVRRNQLKKQTEDTKKAAAASLREISNSIDKSITRLCSAANASMGMVRNAFLVAGYAGLEFTRSMLTVGSNSNSR